MLFAMRNPVEDGPRQDVIGKAMLPAMRTRPRHGRTVCAALLTDTTHDAYIKVKAHLINKLQDGYGMSYVLSCEANDVQDPKDWLDRNTQAVYLEGAMGDGNPDQKRIPCTDIGSRSLAGRLPSSGRPSSPLC